MAGVRQDMCRVVLAAMSMSCIVSFILSILTCSRGGWFKRSYDVHEVQAWNASYLQSHAYLLSGLSGVTGQDMWENMVAGSYRIWDVSDKLYFLEVGMMHGAFARVLLQQLPLSYGDGVDESAENLQVAELILPHDRMGLQQMRMYVMPEKLFLMQYDVVFFPGSLCYANSVLEVEMLLAQLVVNNVLRKNGGVSVMFMPLSGIVDKADCVTVVPITFWASLSMYQVVLLEEDSALGRYNVFLQSIK